MAGKDADGDIGGKIPPDDDEPVPTDPPDDPLHKLLLALTLQRVALAVFVGLAVAIVLVALVAMALPQDSQRSLAISRTLTVLLITALACATVAWLDRGNATMLGRGMRHLLNIQRAAVASFVAASSATVGVAIFVALSALFAGGLEKGLYALASIEFLLKLAAVSAIIVLMTLRKPLVASVATPRKQEMADENGDTPPPIEVDQEDNGRLEFGGVSFAFSLVVVAALIVPGEDLMRMASMFFGGQEKLEQYLPSRPVITVEDDLSSQITRAVVQSIAMTGEFATTSLPDLERKIDTLALQNQIFEVLANNLINNVERRGALTLLREVCDDNEDTLIFANSDSRLLAEHIGFLASEGLIEQPYGDLNSIEITSYGSTVVKRSTGGNCVDFATPEQLAETSSDDPIITMVPYENALTLPPVGMTFAIKVPMGMYRAELVAIDRIDPYLELLTADGRTVIQSDDDGGPGFLDAGLNFTVANGQTFTLRASTIDGQSGRVSLRLFVASGTTAAAGVESSPRARQVTPNTAAATIDTIPFSEVRPVSSEGTVLRLQLDPGHYQARLVASDGTDTYLQLFDAEGELLDENDDGGGSVDGLNSVLNFTVEAGSIYYVRTSSYGITASEAELTIGKAPADARALSILDREVSPLVGSAEIPPEGAAFSFTAIETGEHIIQVARPAGTPETDNDLVGVLFRTDQEGPQEIAVDDDSGFGGFPAIAAALTAGEDYVLVLRHYSEATTSTWASMTISPPVAGTEEEVVDRAEEDPEASAEPAPPVEGDATGSAGSQSDP